MVFLDASLVIYFVEQPLLWGAKASARLASLRGAGQDFAVTDLVRMECLVGPFKANDQAALAPFTSFFAAPGLNILPVTSAVCIRAAQLRASHRFKPLDALHLAAAIEGGCGLFLTNDAKLSSCPGILVEVLS